MRLPDGRVRKLRRSSEEPGCAHELTFSCYRRLPLLEGDLSRRWLLEALDRARKAHTLELWAYVIMPEHVHVLFRPLDLDYRVRNVLQSIKQPVARRAIEWLRTHSADELDRLKNARTESHHFWQPGGGYDRNILESATMWRVVDYIHNNPVKRGLVDDSLDWPWSSARWYAGKGEVVLPMDSAPPRRMSVGQ